MYLYDACILDLKPVDSALEYFKCRTVVSIDVIVSVSFNQLVYLTG